MFVFPCGYRKVRWHESATTNAPCYSWLRWGSNLNIQNVQPAIGSVPMCTVVSLPHIPMWISWGWTLIRLQLTWRYPDHRRDLGPETWRNVHWQLEKATVLGEGYLRLRITVLHYRLIYDIYIYISDSKVEFFFMLAFCTYITIIQSGVMYINNTRICQGSFAKLFSEFPGVDALEMAILPPPTMPSFHTSPVLAPKQQSFWPQQSWAPGTLKDEN